MWVGVGGPDCHCPLIVHQQIPMPGTASVPALGTVACHLLVTSWDHPHCPQHMALALSQLRTGNPFFSPSSQSTGESHTPFPHTHLSPPPPFPPTPLSLIPANWSAGNLFAPGQSEQRQQVCQGCHQSELKGVFLVQTNQNTGNPAGWGLQPGRAEGSLSPPAMSCGDPSATHGSGGFRSSTSQCFALGVTETPPVPPASQHAPPAMG